MRVRLPLVAALGAVWIISAQVVAAQTIPDNQPPTIPGNQQPTGGTLPRQLDLTSPEIIMSMAILGMGVIVMTIIFLLARPAKLSTDGILKVTAVPLIVIAAVFMVTAGYSTDQLASVIGLLGTVAGYLLGARPSTSKAGGGDAK